MNYYEEYKTFSVPMKLIDSLDELQINNEQLADIVKLLSFNTQYIDFLKVNSTMSISRNSLKILSELNLIELKEIQNKIFIDLQPLFKVLFTEKKNVKSNLITANQLDRIKLILNRNIKPYEIDKLNEWLSQGFNLNQIEIAIQKSIVNNVDNFKYVETVLNNSSNEYQNKKPEPSKSITKNFDLY